LDTLPGRNVGWVKKRGNVNQVPLVIAVLAWLCPSLMAGYRLARIALKSI
jgi:hypothetical protein